MELKVIERDDDITHLELVGRLDVMGMHDIDIKFHGYTVSQRQHAIVGMADVDFVASLGLGMLISCAQSLRRSGKKMVLVAPQPEVLDVLVTAGVDMGIPITDTVEAALEIMHS